jgi:hypothetical protein
MRLRSLLRAQRGNLLRSSQRRLQQSRLVNNPGSPELFFTAFEIYLMIRGEIFDESDQ